MALAGLKKMGIDPAPLLKASMVSRARLLNPVGRIPVRNELRFWELASGKARTRSSAFRLLITSPSGLIHYWNTSEPAAIPFIKPWSFSAGVLAEIVHGCWHPRLIRKSGTLRLVLGTQGRPESFRFTDEFGLALLVKRLRHYSRADVPLLAVNFRHSLVGDRNLYRSAFKADAHFSQRETSLVFDPSVTRIRCRDSDRFLLGALLKLAETIDAKLSRAPQAQGKLVSAVTDAIGKGLALGEPQIAQVANALAMSDRTLQRRLKEEGTSFSQLILHVRMETAVGLPQGPLQILRGGGALRRLFHLGRVQSGIQAVVQDVALGSQEPACSPALIPPLTPSVHTVIFSSRDFLPS